MKKRIEVLVDGKRADIFQVLINGVPEIKVSGSRLIRNIIYTSKDVTTDTPVEERYKILTGRVGNMARDAALIEYCPKGLRKLFQRPDVKINYTDIL